MLSTSDKLANIMQSFYRLWAAKMAVQLGVRFLFGENKQSLAQWKLKSDWAKGFFEQNPIGREILRSRGPASLGFLVKQQGRRD